MLELETTQNEIIRHRMVQQLQDIVKGAIDREILKDVLDEFSDAIQSGDVKDAMDEIGVTVTAVRGQSMGVLVTSLTIVAPGDFS